VATRALGTQMTGMPRMRMLRLLRQQANLSQIALGFLANRSQTEVSKAEAGFASWATLCALAEVLGVENPADLTRFVGEPAERPLTLDDIPEATR
jgi:transcriptional regulator with XRE-family HTH domain